MKTHAFVPIILASTLIHQAVYAEDWPQFRGQGGTGVGKVSLPDTWGDDSENVLWKTPLEGVGASSPVIVGKESVPHYWDWRLGRSGAACVVF